MRTNYVWYYFCIGESSGGLLADKISAIRWKVCPGECDELVVISCVYDWVSKKQHGWYQLWPALARSLSLYHDPPLKPMGNSYWQYKKSKLWKFHFAWAIDHIKLFLRVGYVRAFKYLVYETLSSADWCLNLVKSYFKFSKRLISVIF